MTFALVIPPIKRMQQVHIGALVREILGGRKMAKIATLADLGPPSRISKLLDKDDWLVSDVIKASKALGVNLFAYFVAEGNVENMVLEESPAYKLEKGLLRIEQLEDQLRDARSAAQSKEQTIRLLQKINRDLEVEVNTLKANQH